MSIASLKAASRCLHLALREPATPSLVRRVLYAGDVATSCDSVVDSDTHLAFNVASAGALLCALYLEAARQHSGPS